MRLKLFIIILVAVALYASKSLASSDDWAIDYEGWGDNVTLTVYAGPSESKRCTFKLKTTQKEIEKWTKASGAAKDDTLVSKWKVALVDQALQNGCFK